ncbi:hypothetical protein ACWGQ9_27525 [Streptomyces parvus]
MGGAGGRPAALNADTPTAFATRTGTTPPSPAGSSSASAQASSSTGTQSVLWAEDVREKFNAPALNLARYIKDGEVTDTDNGE